ncbi:uncharacterized protein LOC143028972 [Oratosquilla oratoria]|uniref:uncharacterized protein LOC143028972 n=1 Tax=Oratosquilla oratoria TaxID=337810 RepID=UPI003F76FB9E
MAIHQNGIRKERRWRAAPEECLVALGPRGQCIIRFFSFRTASLVEVLKETRAKHLEHYAAQGSRGWRSKQTYPPLHYRRELLALRYVAKALRIPQHPCKETIQRYEHFTNSSLNPLSIRIRSLCEQYSVPLWSIEQIEATVLPPWENIAPKIFINQDLQKKTSSTEELKQKTLETIHKYNDHMALYTDGSKCGHKTGTGLYCNKTRMMFRLPNHTSIYIAELYGIYKALEYAQSDTHSKFVIFTDSLSALKSIKTGNHMENFLLGKIISTLSITSKSITLSWVPSHIGIFGNEKADILAKTALEIDSITDIPLDIGTFNSILRKQLHTHWQLQWNNLDISHKQKEHITDWSTSYRNNRLEEIAIARLRMNSTRLTHLKPYIDGVFPPQCNTCNTILSIRHILLHCSKYNTQRQVLIQHCQIKKIQLSTTNLLTDDRLLIDKVVFYLRTTGLLWEL